MKLWAICDMVTDPNDDQGSSVPAAQLVPGTATAIAVQGPDWALVLVGRTSMAALRAAQGVDLLPDWSLSGRMNALSVSEAAKLTAALHRRGASSAAQWAGNDSYRDVLTAIGRLHDPAFDPENHDVFIAGG